MTTGVKTSVRTGEYRADLDLARDHNGVWGGDVTIYSVEDGRGIWAGAGAWGDGRIVDCDACLADDDDQDASEAVYAALDALIRDEIKSVG